MIDIYRENGIDISGDTYEKLCAFSAFLREYNRKVNLTSITDDRDIHIKHFYDSIRGEKFF
jgi:ribosomal RNA small subunit methyltransferase G